MTVALGKSCSPDPPDVFLLRFAFSLHVARGDLHTARREGFRERDGGQLSSLLPASPSAGSREVWMVPTLQAVAVEGIFEWGGGPVCEGP